MYTVSRLEVITKIVGQQMVVKLMQHNLLEQFGEIAGLTQICSFRNCLRQGHFFSVGGGGDHYCLLELQRNRPKELRLVHNSANQGH